MHLLRSYVLAVVLVMAGGLGGCAGSKEAQKEGSASRRREAVRNQGQPQSNMNLVAPDESVRTIQLFLGQEESRLPVLKLKTGDVLTLKFDLMEGQGRPLSAYFYHADRTWKRDLTPVEYLVRFYQDDLLDYTTSRATTIPYVHYAYQFPNRNIDFLISGNYIIRITEQGREDAVLFERPFIVTEEATAVDFGLDNVMVAGSGYPYIQPIVQFAPPTTLQDNVYDYDVCFVRNGRFDVARCSGRPSLAVQPDMQFYLQPESSFAPEPADYFLDLSSFRVGSQISSTDLSVTPFRVVLEPDYARFPGTPIAPLLNGQTLVSSVVQDVSEPNLAAEYALVRFSFVPPDEQILEGGVVVIGSFSDWRANERNRLEWTPDSQRYEGEILLKQGQYEYSYLGRDRRLRQALQSALPRTETLYAALVYYSDIRLSSDRVLAVSQIITP